MQNTGNGSEQIKNIKKVDEFLTSTHKNNVKRMENSKKALENLRLEAEKKKVKFENEIVEQSIAVANNTVDVVASSSSQATPPIQEVKEEKIEIVKEEKTAIPKETTKTPEKVEKVEKVEKFEKVEIAESTEKEVAPKPTQKAVADAPVINSNAHKENKPVQRKFDLAAWRNEEKNLRSAQNDRRNNNYSNANGQQNRPFNNARPNQNANGQSNGNNNYRQGQNNGPRNNNTTTAMGQRKPMGGASGFGNKPRQQETIAPIIIPANNRKDNKKKPATTFQKDDSRKTLNKRDLMKKGYAVDGTLLGDEGSSRYIKNRKQKKEEQSSQFITITNAIINTDPVPIRVFSEKIGKSATEIIKKLFELGTMANINSTLSFDEAEMIALDYNITLELKMDKTAEDKIAELVASSKNNDDGEFTKRPPVIAVMGHVDHGKTSLIDYIRKTNIVQKEAGGITQHIGAYTINLNGEHITFLDTPGHEAFTAMRRRGANVTDISIIIVAADDGLMPQTKEAIKHAHEAKSPIIIAINKIDKLPQGSDYSRILQDLATEGVVAEEWGGDVIVCPISAKLGTGVPELLENILILSEVLELKASESCPASGSIIEARLDKGAGPVATILVQNGTLKVRDFVVAGTSIGRIKAMTDCTGKAVKTAGPSYAVQVQGFSDVPNAGDQMVVVADEKLAKQVAQERANKERNEMQNRSNAKTLDDMFKNVISADVKTLPIIIKTDVQGSCEAVKQALIELSDKMSEKNVRINIISAGVGAITESDIMLADTTKARIIGFNVKADSKSKVIADRSGIEIGYYRVIYNIIDDIEATLKGMLEPNYKEVIIGHAEVRAVFKISSYGTIAGSYVTDGKVSRNSKVRLLRKGEVVFEGNLSSLKREKDDVKDVAFGYECGIGLEKFADIKADDIIESYILERIENE